MQTQTVINVPDCRFHYIYESDTFSVSPIEAIQEHERLRGTKLDGVPFLEAYGKWLESQGVPPLPLSVVDWLSDHILNQYTEIKKKRYEPRNSPSSSESESSD